MADKVKARNRFLTLFDPYWFVNKIIIREIKKASIYVNGLVLDIGCGSKPYEKLFNTRKYIGVDKKMPNSGIEDICCDCFYLPFKNSTFDSVFSSQVMEHVPEPSGMISEIGRVLKKEGFLILTIPHISRIHGEPDDYFRFTRFGIEHLLNSNCFKVIYIKELCGFWVMWCYLFNFYIYEKKIEYERGPILKRVIAKLFPFIFICLNFFVFLISRTDADTRHTFNYVAVAKKIA